MATSSTAIEHPGSTHQGVTAQRLFTGALVVGPLVAVVLCMTLLWGRAIRLHDVVIAIVLYAVTGHGVSIGYHRLFTHRSFRASRGLKIALGVAGAMAVEGTLASWVANHRRHHLFADHPGDPHSPHRFGDGPMAQLKGFAFAHVGWLFTTDDTPATRFAADIRRDPDLVRLDQLCPLFVIASFGIPFALGWLLTHSLTGALTALIWAGLVRVALLHHVTWSVNSVCHMFGTRPSAVDDRSTNFAPLAVLSFGESWHNYHHAHPSSARHGVGRGHVDSSAALIRIFQQRGWATRVRWPDAPVASSAVRGSR